MRISILLSGIFCFLCGLIFSQSQIGGVISVNKTLLESESPYFVTKNTLVSQGVTLTIEPGVVLHFRDSCILQVDGTLRAMGTAQKPIAFRGMPGASYYNFMPFHGHGWGGIYFSGLSTDYDTLTGLGSTIQHATISRVVGGRWLYGSGPETRETNPLFMRRCSPYISNTEIAFYRGYIGIDESNAIFRNCNIHHAVQGIMVGPLTPSNSYKPIIENSFFHDFKEEFPSDVRGPVVLNGPARFANNCMKNITNEFALAIPLDGPEVLNNRFENCTQVAIGNYGSSYNYKIIGNTFVGNYINMTFTSCPRMPQIYGNNFMSYTHYNIYATQNYWITPGGIPISSDCAPIVTSFDLDLSNNYWGGLITAEIEGSIHDYNDDFIEKINVIYDPISETAFNLNGLTACSFVDLVNGTEDDLAIQEKVVSELHIWPNPIIDGDLLNITVDKVGTYHLKIMNVAGQQIYQREWYISVNGENIQQPLQGLAAGTYFISLCSHENNYIQRIVIVN